MKNEKGFTLVEILAVLSIIGLIMMLIVPVAIGIINDTKDQAYDVQVENIEAAARSYVAEYSSTINELQNTGGTYTLTLRMLTDEGYIDEPIKNPKTNQNFNLDTSSVLVTKLVNGSFSYAVTTN